MIQLPVGLQKPDWHLFIRFDQFWCGKNVENFLWDSEWLFDLLKGEDQLLHGCAQCW
jgi:hypothetical protein